MAKRRPGRPASGRDPDPVHSFRGPKDLWQRIKAKTKNAGTNPTAVIVDFLRWYDREPGAELPERPPVVEDQPDTAD